LHHIDPKTFQALPLGLTWVMAMVKELVLAQAQVRVLAQVKVLVKELVQVRALELVLVKELVLAQALVRVLVNELELVLAQVRVLALVKELAALHHFETLWNQNRHRKLQARQWLVRKRIAVLIVVFC
jgi:hypothetical protein